jgi:cation diffusion facilitator CzcD-associated flavoprotein CzcO
MHKDVVIVGAGISGIGAAYNLQKSCKTKSFTIIEGRSDLGGTWDLFKYPGIRSDSDMHTLGFRFKPWINDKSIADGPSILNILMKLQMNTIFVRRFYSTIKLNQQIGILQNQYGS